MEKLRSKKAYEGNPVGLTDKACKAVAKELDRHLAALWIMYAQYHKHHWLVEGPQFRDLHLFLQSHYEEVNLQLDAVAERITLLGYTPTTRLENYVKLSYIEQESEDVFHIRESLENDMKNERKIAVEIRKSIKVAMEHEDFGTKSMLEGFLFKIEDRAHHLEHFLGEDSLSVGYLHTENSAAH
ncbi:DNA starvation/stationary phase protection protein [Neolewinella lacunae]|uniref:DNA starvation/stationary phase protection protein n=1 Tax=Neolewinella lacunae TaxID=1517758 RepID=A0A923T8H9_9BACT|nr:DNA starvation/stationary phase protection protein [Neolewinella lacunae]MBC6994599.1 DNA starvation/stationary phase protection protein [Neolewinella lacunae]MDN3634471.1 DNA starvation/stationary phase protection protein [Neolewinella lacunae]